MVVRNLKQLVEYLEWADALAWKAVRAVARAESDQRVRDLLYHMHSVQCAYVQLFRGEPMHIPEPDSFGDLVALQAWARECHGELADFMATMTPEALDRRVEFPWVERLAERFGEVHAADVGQALLQLVIHSAHHRGQICTRIRELGGDPPLTDFIAYVWMGEPRPDWETVSG